jgi:hypothetical protein
MSDLHNHQTTVTPHEVACLHNALGYAAKAVQAKRDADEPLTDWDWLVEQQTTTAQRWLANVKESLWSSWVELPEGSHLKEAYRDEVWTWSDRDLAEPWPAVDAPTPDQVGEGPRRPRTQESE